MYHYRNLVNDIYWIGASDRRQYLFEGAFPIPRGISYNAYLALDEKTVLFDTVDKAVSGVFFENLSALLAGRTLDYVVVQHMEPDHCATLGETLRRYPEAKVVCNAKTAVMIRQFFNLETEPEMLLMKEGDTLSTGRHTFTFVMAPMVHWPEVMVTYDSADKILFSADAFGTFGALSGNIFADETKFETEWLPDARRYYTNIVGKYGNQVLALLKKAANLEIAMLCPLHGPVWRSHIDWFIEKYRLWASYTPEDKSVMIAYASVYGNTANAADILASQLAERGVKNIAMFDVSVTHSSDIVAEAFRCSHLVFASTTYNAGIFCAMETLLNDLKGHNLQNRTVALMENGSWAPTSGGLMRGILSTMKNMTVLDEVVTLRSSLKEDQLANISAMADAIVASMPAEEAPTPVSEENIEPGAIFRLSYGLFVLTARQDGKDNGCIVNTVMQVTDTPKRILVTVNKANLTHDMIAATGEFNVSVLTTQAPFRLFQRFGFQSGRDVDKFAEDASEVRTENGVRYIPEYTNAVLSGRVISATDCGTHTMFLADVTEARNLSDVPSVTYQYYFDNIKPKPDRAEAPSKGYVCRICGYVYEGEKLPADFVCPLCKHGAEDFEPIQA